VTGPIEGAEEVTTEPVLAIVKGGPIVEGQALDRSSGPADDRRITTEDRPAEAHLTAIADQSDRHSCDTD
jgi:hypothetical protein